jgi:hypothetical protein
MQLLVGSLWTDPRGQEFEIVELGDGENPWVHYENIRTGQSYSCLAEAFTYRFLRIENDSRT